VKKQRRADRRRDTKVQRKRQRIGPKVKRVVPDPPGPLQHRNSTIIWRPWKQCFTSKGKPVCGLLPVLERYYFPKYNFKQANRGPDTEKAEPLQTKGRQLTGKWLGTKIDKEVEDVINGKKKAVFGEVNVLTLNFFATLTNMRLKAVSAQLPVANDNMHIATRLDVLCIPIDADPVTCNQYTIIELKTGCWHYYFKHTKHALPAPLADLSDSLYTQHQLQLASSCFLFSHDYPLAKLAGAYVIILQGQSVRTVKLSKDIWARIGGALHSACAFKAVQL
jgi:hypothetical protein